MGESIVVKVDATRQSAFKYEGDGAHSQCVDSDGNIDLRKCKTKQGEYLEFQLAPEELAINGVLHKMEFPGENAISFRESPSNPEEAHENSGDSPFGKYENLGNDHVQFRVPNKNHKKKDYKYTLRVNVIAQGAGTVDERSHDPIIQNTGGGYLK